MTPQGGSCCGRYHRRSQRGRYHTDRQPGAALQNTAICPAGPPPAPSRPAWAGAKSHSTHDTVIRPGGRDLEPAAERGEPVGRVPQARSDRGVACVVAGSVVGDGEPQGSVWA
jgi:hypothetical protein